MDGDDVVGLMVRIDGKEHAVRARGGVILCAGGFVMNEEMLAKYAPKLLTGNNPIGIPGDTGTGIMMGMSVGGAAINMHEGFISIPYYPPASITRGILVSELLSDDGPYPDAHPLLVFRAFPRRHPAAAPVAAAS